MPVIVIIRLVWRGSVGWSTMFTEQTQVHASPDPGPAFLSWIAVPWSLHSGCLTAADKAAAWKSIPL